MSLENLIACLVISIVTALLVFISILLYGDLTSEKFELIKTEWTCTQQTTEVILIPIVVNKVTIMQPTNQTVCLQYTKK